jgi:iron complex transport system substrate-binding protein
VAPDIGAKSWSQETTHAHSLTKTLEGGLVQSWVRGGKPRRHACSGDFSRERTPVVFSGPQVCRRTIALTLLLAGVACARGESSAPAQTKAVGDVTTPVAAPADTDDFGVPLPTKAADGARVVSLNPAATELIFAIGAQERLIGRSRWDLYPSAARAIPALGDGIRPNVEAVLAARPTLVVLYATPENRAAADAFRNAGVRTLAVRVDRIAHFLALTRTLGVALGAEAQARVVHDTVNATLERVRTTVTRLVPNSARPTVVWPVWPSPPMVIGGGSFLDELLTIAGAVNVFHDAPPPSLTVSAEEILRRAPSKIVASPESERSLRQVALWTAMPAVQQQQFVRIDPAITLRPSAMLGMAAVQLARTLHPSLADSIR